MTSDDPLLIAELRRDEGVRYSPYLDTLGIQTVGIGHNLVAHPFPDAVYPLTDAQVNQLLADDLAEVFAGLDAHLPWWRDQTQARQRVLANMAFNLGIAGLLTFKNTLLAIQRGHYQLARANMLTSKWASQVGRRARRLAQMIVEG